MASDEPIERLTEAMVVARTLETEPGTPPGDGAGVAAAGAPPIEFEGSEPALLSGATRKSLARLLIAVAGLGAVGAIWALILEDDNTDVGNTPLMFVVLSIVSIAGAILLALGYSTVKVRIGEAPNEPDATILRVTRSPGPQR